MNGPTPAWPEARSAFAMALVTTTLRLTDGRYLSALSLAQASSVPIDRRWGGPPRAACWPGNKRPTKAFQDVVAGGGAGLRILGLEGAVPVEGGLPIVVDGKIIGSIGLSGGSGEQDGMAAKAGADL
jgi:hypothetical protein